MSSDRLQLPPAFQFSDEDTPCHNRRVSRSCCRLRGNPVRRPARLAYMHRVPRRQKPSSSDLPFHERWAAGYPQSINQSINPIYAWIAVGNPNAFRRARRLVSRRQTWKALQKDCARPQRFVAVLIVAIASKAISWRKRIRASRCTIAGISWRVPWFSDRNMFSAADATVHVS